MITEWTPKLTCTNAIAFISEDEIMKNKKMEQSLCLLLLIISFSHDITKSIMDRERMLSNAFD